MPEGTPFWFVLVVRDLLFKAVYFLSAPKSTDETDE